MKIQRAFKVRIYPSNEQSVVLNQTLGSCRFLYNKMLDERIKVYEVLKDDRQALSTYTYKAKKQYKQKDAVALQQAWRKGSPKGEWVDLPRFKAKREHNDTYRTGMAIKVDFDGKTVLLAKRFASSKMCHVGGYVKRGLLLYEQRRERPQCGTHHSQDMNAEINLSGSRRVIGSSYKSLSLGRGFLTR
ncbi:MAG: helix-turn-helix domain-containing protein [Treponema sp.]|jgi:transposase|nr:helix-turn-helix domain-containing protein [Treponema sp.]